MLEPFRTHTMLGTRPQLWYHGQHVAGKCCGDGCKRIFVRLQNHWHRVGIQSHSRSCHLLILPCKLQAWDKGAMMTFRVWGSFQGSSSLFALCLSQWCLWSGVNIWVLTWLVHHNFVVLRCIAAGIGRGRENLALQFSSSSAFVIPSL